MKRLTSLATLLLMMVVCAFAQQPTPLALNPDVKSGKLPNGLTYYILHNEQPKDRANFYIAQKVGSSLETQDQLGLAHFLEHMAFNGITHYPGKDMLNYLQSKGIRFGSDINAYTSFDETVYNINNVITTDKPLMDSVLLVIRDWCDGILLEESEIEAERGVINEEWRSRNGASTRMYEAILPQIFKEYQYQQMPIGKMDVVMNFKPQVLRDYYKKWYRPDLQGIVIVGDFDADEMERKVKDLFSTVVLPENAAPREYVAISDNKEPIYVHFEDPELSNSLVMTFFKSDKTPWEFRNTVEGFMGDALVQTVLVKMIQDRLTEYQSDPECPYAMAQVSIDDFLVASTKDAFDVYVVPKGDILTAYKAAMGIIARACKTGFTQSELERANAELLNRYEKSYNERNNTYNDVYGRELIRHFIGNEPTPGITQELQLAKQLLPMIPVEAYNQIAQQILTAENQVIVVSQPQNENTNVLAEAEVIAALESTLNATYEAYVDEVITEPLIAKLPAPGKVVAKKENKDFGTTEFTLSNGVKVILKTTDFKADEIRMKGVSLGGSSLFPNSEIININGLDAVSVGGLGNFSAVNLEKVLAGKKASVSYGIGDKTEAVNGSCSPKDFETMMQLTYLTFTAPRRDDEAFASYKNRNKAALLNMEMNPQVAFSDSVQAGIYMKHPRQVRIKADMIDKMDYDKILSMYNDRYKDASDFTFIFVGNVDVEQMKPLIAQYLGALPAINRKETFKDNKVEIRQGAYKNEFIRKQETAKASNFILISGDCKYNLKNDILLDMAGQILDLIYTAKVREDEGGTYGVYVGGQLRKYPTEKAVLQIIFDTAPAKRDKLMKIIFDELSNFAKAGSTEENLNKVKEFMLKKHAEDLKENSYWLGGIDEYLFTGMDRINDYEQIVNSITMKDIQKFADDLLKQKNEIEVSMISPEAESK